MLCRQPSAPNLNAKIDYCDFAERYLSSTKSVNLQSSLMTRHAAIDDPHLQAGKDEAHL